MVIQQFYQSMLKINIQKLSNHMQIKKVSIKPYNPFELTYQKTSSDNKHGRSRSKQFFNSQISFNIKRKTHSSGKIEGQNKYFDDTQYFSITNRPNTTEENRKKRTKNVSQLINRKHVYGLKSKAVQMYQNFINKKDETDRQKSQMQLDIKNKRNKNYCEIKINNIFNLNPQNFLDQSEIYEESKTQQKISNFINVRQKSSQLFSNQNLKMTSKKYQLYSNHPNLFVNKKSCPIDHFEDSFIVKRGFEGTKRKNSINQNKSKQSTIEINPYTKKEYLHNKKIKSGYSKQSIKEKYSKYNIIKPADIQMAPMSSRQKQKTIFQRQRNKQQYFNLLGQMKRSTQVLEIANVNRSSSGRRKNSSIIQRQANIRDIRDIKKQEKNENDLNPWEISNNSAKLDQLI